MFPQKPLLLTLQLAKTQVSGLLYFQLLNGINQKVNHMRAESIGGHWFIADSGPCRNTTWSASVFWFTHCV